MGRTLTTVPVELGFLPPRHAVADPDRPGLLRAGPRSAAPTGADRVEFQRCEAVDGARDPVHPDLLVEGFDVVDLSPLADLQAACARTRSTGRIAADDAGAIRAALEGAVLRCESGRSLQVLFIAEEGFIMRSSGPDRTAATGPRPDGMNDHGGASSVHADQDVFGTPLTQLMDGRAPTLLRHDSPDGSNDADLLLVNLWIPLQQITQPLVLADGRSVDRRRHQLRYGLPTGSFLDRDEDLAINDIWAFLHDPGQRWYCRSEMDHRRAYVFNTLSTPHGAGVLPGEDAAAWCAAALERIEAAVGAGEPERVRQVADDERARLAGPALHPDTPPTLRAAVAAMAALIEDAAAAPVAVAGDGAATWLGAARAARRAVVRMSLELRLVVSAVG